MKKIIHNIGTLVGILPEGVEKLEGTQMNNVECIENAYLIIEDGIITEFGHDENFSKRLLKTLTAAVAESIFAKGKKPLDDCEIIDANGGFVMPTFCDSHTHIVYSGCRDGEFRDKIAGLSYEEISQITNTTLGTVKSRLARARVKLQDELKDFI